MIRSEFTILKVGMVILICFVGFLSMTPSCFGGDNSSYKLLSERNVNAMGGLVKRQVVRIEIPEGRTREDVEATFKRAVKEIYASRKKLNALSVEGFRPQDDKTGPYTIGEAVYAPNGNWAEAANKTASMKISITLGALYFKSKKVIFGKGTMIGFVSSEGKDIKIFKTQGNWKDENILMVIKPGQAGKVLQSKVTAYGPEMSDTEYQIEIDGKVGWVDEKGVELYSNISLIKEEQQRQEEIEKKTKAGYTLELISWQWYSEHGYAIVEGLVKNISESSVQNIEAVAILYDENDKFITSDNSLIEYRPLLPEQISPFKIYVTWNPRMNKCSIGFKHFMGSEISYYYKK